MSVSVESDDAHDWMCPQYCDCVIPCIGGYCTLCNEVECYCDLIAKVRANEREEAVWRIRHVEEKFSKIQGITTSVIQRSVAMDAAGGAA